MDYRKLFYQVNPRSAVQKNIYNKKTRFNLAKQNDQKQKIFRKNNQ